MTAQVVKLRLVKGVGAGRKVAVSGVLAGARKAKLSECLVIGTDADGELYAASSESPADTLWLLEFFKKWLLDGCPAAED